MAQWKNTAPEPTNAGDTIEQLRVRVQYLHTLLSDVEEALSMALADRDALKARVEAAEAALAKGSPTYRMTWIAGARPPAHPGPMTGRLAFLSEAEAWKFFRHQANDARLVSLHKSITIDCGEVPVPADLAERVRGSHE